MINFFKSLSKFMRIHKDNREIRMTRRQRYIEEYLSQSTDMSDLERREKELERKGYFF